MTPILGAHFSVAGGLHNALRLAARHACGCAQLFVANQRQWRRPALAKAQIDLFAATRRQSGIRVVGAHGSYLVNLAAADPGIYRRSVRTAADEYRRCGILGLDFLVIHPGAHGGQGEEHGIARIVAALDAILREHSAVRARILLETTAGQGTSLGHEFGQLASIIRAVADPARLGVCLDTCHVFAAGYDIRTRAGYERTIAEYERAIGLERLAAVHINDSKFGLGSRVDRHAHIGKGLIGKEAFRAFLTDPRFAGVPFIIETPKARSPGGRDMDALNLAALRRLCRA